MEDTIQRSHQISKDMRKAYEKKLKKQKKKAEKFEKKSVVDEFIKDQESKKPKLTPAEKAKRTKAKKKAQQESAEKIAREKERTAKWIEQKHEKTKAFKEALAIGSGKSSLH